MQGFHSRELCHTRDDNHNIPINLASQKLPFQPLLSQEKWQQVVVLFTVTVVGQLKCGFMVHDCCLDSI